MQSLRIVSIPAEIQTWYLPNINVESYSYTILLGGMSTAQPICKSKLEDF